MHRNLNRNLICLTLACATLLAAPGVTMARNDVIIVPARQRTIALAVDIQALRNTILITYRGSASTARPLLHVWEPRRNQWRQISPEEFAFGQFMPSQPARMYIVGTESDVPPTVLEGASQARNVIRIQTLNIAEMANIFHQTMSFSQREWKTLAERHGLETRDLNYEQRRWGRFGPPGTRLEPPAPSQPRDTVKFPEEEFPPLASDPDPTPAVETEASEAVVETPEPAPVPVFIPDAAATLPLAPEEELPAPAIVPAPATTVQPEKGTDKKVVSPSAEPRPEDK